MYCAWAANFSAKRSTMRLICRYGIFVLEFPIRGMKVSCVFPAFDLNAENQTVYRKGHEADQEIYPSLANLYRRLNPLPGV